MPSYKLKLWIDFCKRFRIGDLGVPLFNVTNRSVSILTIGRGPGRHVLQRSAAMDKLIVSEVQKVNDDHKKGLGRYDGLIYLMYKMRGDLVIPVYVGKALKHRQGTDDRLSATLQAIERNQDKFCRWGYGYAYHVGGLSAIVCPGHPDEKKAQKYVRWADRLFKNHPSKKPKLKAPVYFWIKAWKKGETGIWPDFGPTTLTFLESLLIGIAADLFPHQLLNDGGLHPS
ncbi:MAG: hypothetical protein PVG51_12825 [Desulfosarcina sp.]|jgi:hypothetical protein